MRILLVIKPVLVFCLNQQHNYNALYIIIILMMSTDDINIDL